MLSFGFEKNHYYVDSVYNPDLISFNHRYKKMADLHFPECIEVESRLKKQINA